MKDERRFLFDQFFNTAWNASVQRNKTYTETFSKKQKKEFQDTVRMEILTLLDSYLAPKTVSDELHVQNLKIIQDVANDHSKILVDGTYKRSSIYFEKPVVCFNCF